MDAAPPSATAFHNNAMGGRFQHFFIHRVAFRGIHRVMLPGADGKDLPPEMDGLYPRSKPMGEIAKGSLLVHNTMQHRILYQRVQQCSADLDCHHSFL